MKKVREAVVEGYWSIDSVNDKGYETSVTLVEAPPWVDAEHDTMNQRQYLNFGQVYKLVPIKVVEDGENKK